MANKPFKEKFTREARKKAEKDKEEAFKELRAYLREKHHGVKSKEQIKFMIEDRCCGGH